MKIFLNPGHAPGGDPDPGAVSPRTGLQEADVAAAVSTLLAGYLEAVGLATETLQSDSLEEICSAANAGGADYFISVHCNSAANLTAHGTETWCCYGSDAGEALAQCINDQITASLGTTDRGVKIARPGVNGLYVLTNTFAPAVLVELAFISHAGDETLLADNQDDFARAIARGVTDFLIS